MSLGEDRVRVKFNPAADKMVDALKQETARLIDVCQFALDDAAAVGRISDEEIRLWKLAQTSYEEAAMWAVKAATFRK